MATCKYQSKIFSIREYLFYDLGRFDTSLQRIFKPMKYETLLFDLGGVIIDLNIERFHTACKKLGIKDPQQFFSLSTQDDFISQFEMGKIDEKNFLSKFSKELEQTTSTEIIKEAWCSMIDGIQPGVIETLKTLKNHYQIYALSNTNSIHLHYINKLLEQEHSVQSLQSLFHGCHLSFEINLRKPSQEYFENFIKKYSLNKNTALFIDDILKNTEACERAGIKSLVKSQNISLQEFLKQHNII
jgi:putative hydrolase of the HAD superfamily